MSVFGVLRGFTFLARDVFEAALYLLPAPGLSGYDLDGADLLAEREARVEVTEPQWSLQQAEVCRLHRDAECRDCDEDIDDLWIHPRDLDCCLGGDFPPAADDAPTPPDHPSYPQTNEPNQTSDSIFRSGGQTKEYGPRPRLSTPSWFKSTPESEAMLNQERLIIAAQETGAAVEALIAIAEDIRNLLQHDGGRGDGKDVGERAESSSGASKVESPTSPPRPRPSGSGPRCTAMFIGIYQCRKRQGHTGDHATHQNGYGEEYVWPNHNAPVASASPPTPADATAKTLANDPQSVHQRHMRRLLGEDK